MIVHIFVLIEYINRYKLDLKLVRISTKDKIMMDSNNFTNVPNLVRQGVL